MTLFPEVTGIKQDKMMFQTITINSSSNLTKGLFICSTKNQNLAQAITNGAICAIWPKTISVPTYTPNHFPMIYVNNSLEALLELVRVHKNKITLKKHGDLTNMIISKQDIQLERIYDEILLLLNEGQQDCEMERNKK